MDMKKVKEVLNKFDEPNSVSISSAESKEELEILEHYASIGMVRFGFSYKKRKSEAVLTNQGKWFLKQL